MDKQRVRQKFKALIEQIIAQSGKSQNQLSKEMGLSSTSFTNWKEGKVDLLKINLSTFLKILSLKNWNAEELLVYLELREKPRPSNDLPLILDDVSRLSLREKADVFALLLSEFNERFDRIESLLKEEEEQNE